jgi:hypothetical protein
MSEAYPQADPRAFAAWVRASDDDTLAAVLREHREAILTGIFESLVHAFSPAAAGDLRAVLEHRIGDGPAGGVDRFQVVIDRGSCRLQRDGEHAPDVTVSVGAVDFVRWMTGAVSGSELFVFGRLTLEGDLALAARGESLFAPPDLHAS